VQPDRPGPAKPARGTEPASAGRAAPCEPRADARSGCGGDKVIGGGWRARAGRAYPILVLAIRRVRRRIVEDPAPNKDLNAVPRSPRTAACFPASCTASAASPPASSGGPPTLLMPKRDRRQWS
jgi:hypothetical protein